MLILIYLLIVAVGIFVILKVLNPRLDFKLRFHSFFLKLFSFKMPSVSFPQLGGLRLKDDITTQFGSAYPAKVKVPVSSGLEGLNDPIAPQPPIHSYDRAVQPNEDQANLKLESLLAEKNKQIGSLEEQLKALRRHEEEFDKVRSILDEELKSLREQNRTLRSELSLLAPALSPKVQ